MGGRGASSGISDKGIPYGKEYKSLLKFGNIKFLTQVKEGSVSTPFETMTRGRVYVTIDSAGRAANITYYDKHGRRSKSINLYHSHKEIKGPHTHIGYIHAEKGTRRPTHREQKMIDLVTKLWNNRKSKQ